jgi:hypothetical protein
MECASASAKKSRLAAKEAAKEAHVYPVTLEPGQVTVTEQLIVAAQFADGAFAAANRIKRTTEEEAARRGYG